jgi:tetratricopeptide (TPR) repeat protein
MQRLWGVPDDAAQFSAACDQRFGRLRLYPFVRRFNCLDMATYHRSVDDGFKVTVATPHLVPAECWNYLCYKVKFAPLYKPNPNPHINEWHNHNPPPGTVYDLGPRLNHPSLVARPDAVARMEALHELAPCLNHLSRYLLERKCNNRPTCEQAMAMYRRVLPYSAGAARAVAMTARDQPDQFEKLMLEAAQLNPHCYYSLADFAADHRQNDKAAEYLEKGCAADPDSVGIASHAPWRVKYYLGKGNREKAREIADQAAEVYSFDGLESKAIFMETTTNYEEAFEWYGKIEERYDNASPLLGFCPATKR